MVWKLSIICVGPLGDSHVLEKIQATRLSLHVQYKHSRESDYHQKHNIMNHLQAGRRAGAGR